MPGIRVLIADDHPMFRSGVRAVLDGTDDIDVVAEASDGAEAVTAVERHSPQVVLMDLRMPEVDGVAATARIKAARPDTHVLVLTTYDTDADILRAVEAGAIGYLLKDVTREDLLGAVRAAARGQPALSPGVAGRLIGQMRSAQEGRLSAREIEVLEYAARGLANKEIATRLSISEATVKTPGTHLRQAGCGRSNRAVTTALERGIIRLAG